MNDMYYTSVQLYSNKAGEIFKFLDRFYNSKKENLEEVFPNTLEWKKTYENPVELADIVGSFIDNQEDYALNMWISMDENFFINVTTDNADDIIRYLYERFPY
ncbi:MAG: hypothetical protein ACLSHH_05980 [Clostridia bacterium]